MIEDNRPRMGLGRGLAALMGENSLENRAPQDQSAGQRKVPIEFVRPNPKNPRRTFGEEQLDELAKSIAEKGIVQPILVRNVAGSENRFEIIAGERRWRAAQKANLHEVPVIVIEASDREALELAIVENVQRADLNAVEEAKGYEQLAGDFGYTQADLSRIIGKSRSHIANTLRLLKLPDYSRELLVTGALSAGHGRALLSFDDADAVAKRAVDEGLTVRDLEKLAQQKGDASTQVTDHPDKAKKLAKDADTRSLEQTLTDALGLTVSINNRGQKGEVTIKYKSLEQLDALCLRLRS